MNGESFVKQRIKELLAAKKTTITAVSKIADVPQSRLTRQINSNVSLSAETLLCIYELFPDVSLKWLFSGQGEMLKDKKNLEDNNMTISIEKQNNDPHGPVSRAKYEELHVKYVKIMEDYIQLLDKLDKLTKNHG